ncbi:FAD-dependent monooxygenase [Amycolatopsis endophytica]|uniref:2-polyprenyl-6-methoxyphenol hydroxylase-like FAD-dependent oxidoreductase n=1 Tax=Amycolatopsis endophytica TaxID=860233 RepID=A0A853AW08_9PSEU|nr:FAD-dependent monooxygenase [Amycolatopsis endophytica]NYI86829.1 2-polyprenyl-6-methoxyphenol hydroxylase-like FAD-dependent oxidoreductase [Amycolatopsis endophytica]
MSRTVLISGASIAGPSVAFWLNRLGYSTVVVERAPALREGGQAVDFRGEQVTVLRRMGVLEEIRAHRTSMGEQHILDASGDRVASLPASMISGEVEIQRGDLSRILHDATKERTEYVFGDWITSLTETASGVEVTFAHGSPRTVDLVIGADGLHSGTRALTFGPESEFRTGTGYAFAGFSAPNHLRLDHTGLISNVLGRGVMLSAREPDRPASVGLVFALDGRVVDRKDESGLRSMIAAVYAGVGWEVPRLLAALPGADDLYFDELAHITLPGYHRGRIALVGDAGWGVGPGGGGTGLAMMAAYVLAGELSATDGDHETAFARYEATVRPAAEAGAKQAKNTGSFLAPRTARGLWLRNQSHRMLTTRLFSGMFDRMTVKAANTLRLRDYGI